MATKKLKLKVAIIGSSRYDEIDDVHKKIAYDAGKAIADSGCILLTGGGKGVSEFAANGAIENGGLCIGISPADNYKNHVDVFKNPALIFDALIFTGFGYKGRNVVLVRSCDAVIALNGGVGTLNELTIALDEGKDIGILSNSGLTINHFLDFYNKISNQRKFNGSVIVRDKPEELIKAFIELSLKRMK
ncbi:MAG: LOG family protein [Candidatus Parcubacteria bacterium]|nr:LOG family protein [Candidatus Parcubacteria bacterium]